MWTTTEASRDATAYRPEICVWELTCACNLRCGHCGSSAGRPRPNELDTGECLEVVRSLAALGCRVITLSGGEPTLRADWEKIARAIRDCGMLPNMVTNGVAMTAELARRMKDAGLANVAVSIDGPKDVHDRIRGKSTFEKSCRAVEELGEAGVSTVVMTTINALNAHRLEETYRVAEALGAKRWRTQLAKPMGNMSGKSDLSMRPTDLLLILPELYRLDTLGDMAVGIGDSLGYYGPYDAVLRSTSWQGTPQCWGGCQAGMKAIGIESDGGIKGCLSIQAFRGDQDRFIEGNVRQRSLAEIWNDPAAFAYNRRFRLDELTGFCRRCEHRARCRGGARCVSTAVCGRVSEDPFCYHRVATLAQRRPSARLKRGAAAAASVVGLGLLMGGCSLYTEEKDPPADANQTPAECKDVCCECEYGVLPPEVEEACCAEPIDCEEVCCECDYGVLPPEVEEACCEAPIDCENVCCECDYGVLPPEVEEACCAEPIDCEEVCCECDYGVLPPEVAEACCEE